MNENPHKRSFPMWLQQPLPEDQLNNPFLNPRPPPFFAADPSWPARQGRIPANRGKNPAPAPPSAPSKARRFAKRRFSRFAPFAPRNTTSFIIRAKRSGGIASQASPYPLTPAILPTPRFSPSSEGVVDMAKEEWGVDGYGSMKGLIRLRSPVEHDDDEEWSDVEEHVDVERRLDHDLSRFEMVYNPQEAGGAFLVDNWVAGRGPQLEEENLTLRERMFLMEREMEEMKSRLLLLEMRFGVNRDDNNDVNEEVLDNGGAGDLCSEDLS